MKKYLQKLNQKCNFLSCIVISYTILLFVLRADSEDLISKILNNPNKILIITLLGLGLLSFVVLTFKSINKTTISWIDSSLLINFIFLLIFPVYLFIEKSQSFLYKYALIANFLLLAIILIMFIYRIVKVNKNDEQEIILTKGIGSINNYYHLLDKNYNLIGLSFFAFALYALVYYVDANNLSHLLINNKFYLFGVLAALSIAFVVYLIMFIVSMKKRSIALFDAINYICLTAVAVFGYNMVKNHTNKYYMIAYFSILGLALILFLVRSFRVSKIELVEEDDLSIEKHSLSHYIFQLNKSTSIVALMVLSSVITLLLLVFINSNLLPIHDFTKSLIVILFVMILLGLTISIFSNLNSKTIKSIDASLFFLFSLSLQCNYITVLKAPKLIALSASITIISLILLMIRSVKVKEKVLITENVSKEDEKVVEEEQKEESIETNSVEEATNIETVEESTEETDVDSTNEDEVNKANIEEELDNDDPEEDEIIEEQLDTTDLENDEIIENIEEEDIEENEPAINILDYTNPERNFDEYFELFQTLYNNANISLPNFDNSKNVNILRSVFVNITSLDELKGFWEAYSSKASSYNLLQLSPYDGFALSYLFQKYPGLKKDILDNKHYFTINDCENYYYRLRKTQPRIYSKQRKLFFDKLFEKYDDVMVPTILSSVYDEVKNYLNKKIQKKILKVEVGRAQSLASYDLYLIDTEFDFAKARRQVTKFIEEYNQIDSNNDSTKVYKDFIDNTILLDYAPVILPFLSTLITTVNNKERLLNDICKKTNIYEGKSFKNINTLNKMCVVIIELLKFTKSEALSTIINNSKDLIFINSLSVNICEVYGTNSKVSHSIKELIVQKLKKDLEVNKNILLDKKFNPDNLHIVINYLKEDEKFTEYMTNIINLDTVYRYISAYVFSAKEKNQYTYQINTKGLSAFIKRGTIIRLVKQKETNAKQELILELLRKKTVTTRLKLDLSKM